MKTDLSKYDNGWYNPGPSWKRVLWYYCSLLVLQNNWLPFSAVKILVLRAFGAKLGKGVIVKPNVTIKYPWKLQIGSYCWIGEQVWIDNLAPVLLGDNVCLSQGAYLLTGNHNYKSSLFDLVIKEITLEDGVWIGAKAIVCPGITCHSHAVLAVNSVATKDLEQYTINQGNPAIKVKQRIIYHSL